MGDFMTRDEMQTRYRELLAAPNLWPVDVAMVRWLAVQLGRRVEFQRVSLLAKETRQ